MDVDQSRKHRLSKIVSNDFEFLRCGDDGDDPEETVERLWIGPERFCCHDHFESLARFSEEKD